MQKITPFLWFDNQARDAAKFYLSVFKNSKLKTDTKLEDTPSGKVDILTVELNGQDFMLMSAGPYFKFTEAISFVVGCDGQEETDYYWDNLSEGGEKGQCGWLKDKFGVSWQIVPNQLNELMSKDKTGKVQQAMLKMKKIVIEDLEKAYREDN